MSQKSTKTIFVVFAAIVVVLAAVILIKSNKSDAPIKPSETEVSSETVTDERDVDPSELTETEVLELPIPLETAARERILGNPDAEIKISEHSSFSCGHCAKFHETTFKEFKANWLDTGKAYLVFSDFPLNAPALHASLAARCINDDEQYFAAVEELFATQKDWAYQNDYFTPLKAIFAKYGLTDNMFKACIRNEELQGKLLDKVRAAQQQFAINSTPSFVVNNVATIAGGSSYEQFNQVLEGAVEQSKAPAEAPAAAAQEGNP